MLSFKEYLTIKEDSAAAYGQRVTGGANLGSKEASSLSGLQNIMSQAIQMGHLNRILTFFKGLDPTLRAQVEDVERGAAQKAAGKVTAPSAEQDVVAPSDADMAGAAGGMDGFD